MSQELIDKVIEMDSLAYALACSKAKNPGALIGLAEITKDGWLYRVREYDEQIDGPVILVKWDELI